MSSAAIDAYNAEIQQSLETLSDDEAMLKRVAKYLRRLVKERQPDPTCMSREEFFGRVDRALEQAKCGNVYSMLPNESLDDFLKRIVG